MESRSEATQPKPTASRSDAVYERLRAAIVSGELRPNERLMEADLAARFEVSRTPVRESLKRLATEGLLRGSGHRLAVREHSAAEIRDIYEVRAALEGYAARLAAERGDEAAIQRIADACTIPPQQLAHLDRAAMVAVNDAFHTAIMDAAGNPRLEDVNRRNREVYFSRRIAAMYSDAEAETSLAEHARVLDALRAHDGERAERETRAHVLRALDVALRDASG